jgi:hypothetical protein
VYDLFTNIYAAALRTFLYDNGDEMKQESRLFSNHQSKSDKLEI